MVLNAGERRLKNTNAANQANVLATPYRTIQFFSQIFAQIIFYVGHSEKAELYKARDKAS